MKIAENQVDVNEGRYRIVIGDHLVIIDPNCEYCLKMAEGTSWFFPRHDGSSFCESGKRPHCTCDRCF